MLVSNLVRIFKRKEFLVNGTAAMIFLVACLLTILTQLSKIETDTSKIPNADLEIQSLEQVEEINAHSLKTFEISPSQNN